MPSSFRQFKILAQKPIDAWTEVLIVDIFTTPLAYLILKFSKSRSLPYAFTFTAFFIRLIASILFFLSEVLYGGLAFFASIMLDSLDGKLSRATHNGKDPELRGTLDFTLDALGLSASLGALIHHFINNGMLHYAGYTSMLAIMYYLNLACTSSKFRLLALSKLSPEVPLSRIYLDNMLVKAYWFLQKRLIKYRIVIHPSSVDAEFLLFVIGPFTNFNFPIIFPCCLAIMIIDTIITGLVPTFLLLKKA